jgi:hypothetical protein
MGEDELIKRRDKADFFGTNKENAKCQLCCKTLTMSKSHVPPDGLIEQKHRKRTAQHYFFGFATNYQYTNLQSGVYFYTLCKQCNEMIGSQYDSELIKFSNTVKRYWNLFPHSYSWSITCKPNRIARAIIAGMLTPKCNGIDDLWQPIQNYVENQNYVLPDMLKIGFWLHNHHSVSVIPQMIIIDPSKPPTRIEFIMKYFPIAWIVYIQDPNDPEFCQRYGVHNFSDYLSYDIDEEVKITINPQMTKHEFWPWICDNLYPVIGPNAWESAVVAIPD